MTQHSTGIDMDDEPELTSRSTATEAIIVALKAKAAEVDASYKRQCHIHQDDFEMRAERTGYRIAMANAVDIVRGWRP